ncbi:hypothetical protein JCM17846_24140 [Iodidimonas nitroreducens]|uniref:Diaminopimelate epimerase n=1 Tax=Iodidimonas nitroreducens TaxID=1236968 RepID=A0A5A7N8R2_9PROT|nr:hypothetical protein JCM17846_24140 [Iodidimonas nitroreducens]
MGAHRRGFAARAARVEMPGGPLQIHWADDDHVLMTGAVRTAFRGTVNLADMAHD